MTQHVIFLDFDGVLSTSLSMLATGSIHTFDPVTMKILNYICAASGAKIVCTSTRAQAWMPEKKERAEKYFKEAGLDLSHLHADWSCRYDTGPRDGHIMRWLREHPDVKKYAVVDDNFVEVKGFVKVDPYNGLTLQNFIQIAEFLDFPLEKALQLAQNEHPEGADTDYRVARLKIPTPRP